MKKARTLLLSVSLAVGVSSGSNNNARTTDQKPPESIFGTFKTPFPAPSGGGGATGPMTRCCANSPDSGGSKPDGGSKPSPGKDGGTPGGSKHPEPLPVWKPTPGPNGSYNYRLPGGAPDGGTPGGKRQ